jgi:hypothetical protein
MKSTKITNVTSSNSTTSFGLLVLTFAGLVFLLLAIVWPLFSIWALNMLFGLSIKYTFWNWLACWILILTFQGAINVRNERVLSFKKQANK